MDRNVILRVKRYAALYCIEFLWQLSQQHGATELGWRTVSQLMQTMIVLLNEKPKCKSEAIVAQPVYRLFSADRLIFDARSKNS